MAKKREYNFFDKLFLWLNVLLCIALLISFLSPITDPRKFWIVAFFGLAYPFLLLGNSLLVIYWILRKSRYAWLSLVTILLGWNVLRDNIGFNFSEDTIAKGNQEKHLRVMTYNVHFFKRYGDDNDEATKSSMLSLINKQQPDVLGIQEFYTRPKGKYDIADSLQRIMKTTHYYFEPFTGNNSFESLGMAVFSRFPIINRGKIILSSETGSGNQCLYIDFKKNGKMIRFYSVHLQSIGFVQSDYAYLSKVSQKGKPNLTSSKIIAGKLKRAFIERSTQVVKVKAHAAQCPYPYIISGDFNDTPASFAVTQMAKGIQNAFREKGSGLGRTYNGSFPNYQIDYIMPGNEFNVSGYRIIKEKLSDHYPVCSDLVMK